MNPSEVYAARLEDPSDETAAYAFCARLAAQRRGDFPVARRFASRGLRPHFEALYAFARIARDISEAPEHEGARRERLLEWRRQLHETGKSPANHPVFLALGKTMRERSLPVGLLDDMVGACIQDVEKPRYATFDELGDLCRRAANPVGRLVLILNGYYDDEAFRYSDVLCTALLLARFWRDLSLDLKRDRIYIPEEDFKTFGYTEADLRMGVCNEKFRDLMKFEINRTRALFEQARPLPDKLRRPFAWQVRLTWYGGREVLRQIRKLGFDTITHRPLLSGWDWLPLILRTILKP